MTDPLLKDPKFMRSYILNKVLLGTKLSDAYKNFCKAMGDDAMEYREFDYWFYRFYNGNRDLTSDEYSQSSTLSLPDMPIEIFRKIVNDTTWKEVIALRQVSRNTRSIVDNMKFVYKEGTIITSDVEATLTIDDVVYRPECMDDWTVDLEESNEMHLDRILRKMDSLMKHQKVFMEKLVVDIRATYDHTVKPGQNHIYNRLRFAKFDFRVKTLCDNGRSFAGMYGLLDCLEPVTLEEIQLEKNHDLGNPGGLKQWQQAKRLKVGFCEFEIPIDSVEHFHRIDVEHCPLKDLEELLLLKDNLVESPTFEKCCLKVRENNDRDDDLDMDAFEQGLGPHVAEASENPNYRRYTINAGKKVFELKVGRKLFEMERIH